MEFLLGWILFSIIPAIIASNKGRNGFGWFMLSLVISPLFAGILVALLPAQKTVVEARAMATDSKKCPRCAELVKREAQVCRFCQFEFPAPEKSSLMAATNPPEKCPKCGLRYFHAVAGTDNQWECDNSSCSIRFLVPSDPGSFVVASAVFLILIFLGQATMAEELAIQGQDGRRAGELRLDQDRGTADIFDAKSNRSGWGTRRSDGSWDLYNKDGSRRGYIQPARPESGQPSRLILTPNRR